MKLPDKEQFNFKEVVVAEDACWLITPKDMGTDWTDENARFRSCIVRQEDNFVISQGFGKFTNFGEKPDFQPWDNDWKFEARHKLDGSLLIVSRYKGEWILRTRGTVDARSLPNGHEIDGLMQKYALFFNDKLSQNIAENIGGSFLFEWTTPTNIIVLREHDTPTLTLLGIVTHDKCEYISQSDVDDFNFGVDNIFERPKKYEYNSIAECIADVEAWEGKEGVVLYNGQTLKKIKSELYKEAHKIMTGMTTIGHFVDFFLASPKFNTYEGFFKYVENTFDFELADKSKLHIEKIANGWAQVEVKAEKVKLVVEQVREGFSRKEQAQQFQLHWKDWRLPFAFNLLDNKEPADKVWLTALTTELL